MSYTEISAFIVHEISIPDKGIDDTAFKLQRKLFALSSNLEKDNPGYFQKRPFLTNELTLTKILLKLSLKTELPHLFSEFLQERVGFIPATPER